MTSFGVIIVYEAEAEVEAVGWGGMSGTGVGDGGGSLSTSCWCDDVLPTDGVATDLKPEVRTEARKKD